MWSGLTSYTPQAVPQHFDYNLWLATEAHAITIVNPFPPGGASDVVGNVTVASMYAYVDQALGPWDQRPVFKSHVSKLIPMRRCSPAVNLNILRLLPRYFLKDCDELKLDPSYEPDCEPCHAEHQEVFSNLQKLRAARLLEPVGEDHMYYAAMNSKSCRLTPLGRYYWKLANSGQL